MREVILSNFAAGLREMRLERRTSDPKLSPGGVAKARELLVSSRAVRKWKMIIAKKNLKRKLARDARSQLNPQARRAQRVVRQSRKLRRKHSERSVASSVATASGEGAFSVKPSMDIAPLLSRLVAIESSLDAAVAKMSGETGEGVGAYTDAADGRLPAKAILKKSNRRL